MIFAFNQRRLIVDRLRLRVDRRRSKADHTIEFDNLTLINAVKKIDYFNKQSSDYNCERDSQHRNCFNKKNCFDLTKNAFDCYYIN